MEFIKPKNVKSGEVDGILAEMLKTDIETKAKYFEKLFKNIWSKKNTTIDLTQSLIVKMPWTGDGSILDNYRDITLLSVHVPIKIFSRIVIQR